MSDGFTFRSRAQARQYFAAVNDAERLSHVDATYAHLPDRIGSPTAPALARPNPATVPTPPYRPKPPGRT